MNQIEGALEAARDAIGSQDIGQFGTGYTRRMSDGEPEPYPIRDELVDSLSKALTILRSTPARKHADEMRELLIRMRADFTDDYWLGDYDRLFSEIEEQEEL